MKKTFDVIPLVIYPFDVVISINQSDKQFLKSMDGQDMTDSEGLFNLPETTAARCVMIPSNLTVIRFKIGDEIRHDHIAHEIFHAVTFIMERVGMEFIVMKSDEAYAYLIGYITKKVYEILNKNHESKRSKNR